MGQKQKTIVDISSHRSRLRVKIGKKTVADIERLLDLGDKQFCENRVGKLIRDNFRRRGWLKGKVRGKPGGGFYGEGSD